MQGDIIYYEEGTGSWGDASKLIFVAAPDADTSMEGDDDVWEHVDSQDQLSMDDVHNVIRNAIQGQGDWRGQLDWLAERLGVEL